MKPASSWASSAEPGTAKTGTTPPRGAHRPPPRPLTLAAAGPAPPPPPQALPPPQPGPARACRRHRAPSSGRAGRGRRGGGGGGVSWAAGACAPPCLPRSALPCRGRPAGVAPRPGERASLGGRQVAPAPSIRSRAAEQRTPQTIPSAAAKLNNLPAPRALPKPPPFSAAKSPGRAGPGRARNRQPGRGYRSGATSLGLLAAYADTGQGKLENGGEASGSLEGGLGIAVRGCGERPGRGPRSPGPARTARGARPAGHRDSAQPRWRTAGPSRENTPAPRFPTPPPFPSAPRRGGGGGGGRERERE